MILNELFEAGNKHVTFCFGRMNPPTIGHAEVFKTMAKQGGDMKIFVSQSQDKKKNPLDYATKIKFIKAMFPEYASKVIENASLNTIVKVATFLYDQGYTTATFVAGSDRLEDMKKLLEGYNGVEGKSHGYYKFEVLDFVSSGEREDGAEGVAGVSASGAREAAANNNFEKFKAATGAGELAKSLFAAVRKGMNITEARGYNPLDIPNPDDVHKPIKGDEPVKRGDMVWAQDPHNIAQAHAGKVKRIGRTFVFLTLKNGEELAVPHDEVSKSYQVLSDRANEILKKKAKASKQLKMSEAPIEMDPADPMDPIIFGHDKANPAKLKYRMMRAAGQIKDLASRVDNASPAEWQTMAKQFDELKMNVEQIRHALDELAKVKRKGGLRSRGIDKDLT